MNRIIYDADNGTEYPHPRKDGRKVEGLEPPLYDLLVVNEEAPVATVGYGIRPRDPVYNLQAGTLTRGWELIKLPDAIPVARWVEFGVALAATPSIEQWFRALPSINSILAQMIGGGLLQAAQGDSQTFLAGWQQCLSAGLVSPELAAQVQSIATAYDLPAEFVSALAPK